jgi:hypothetical protein
MNRLLLLLICLLPISAQAQITAPPSVKAGDAIHFQYDEYQPGDEVRWLVLNPFDGVNFREFRPSSSADFIIDPPYSFTGRVRVQMIVIDVESRLKDIRTIVVDIEGAAPVPTPPPEPLPPNDGYNGDNDLGVGQLSYTEAPEYDKEVGEIIERAAKYLRGYPSLKVVHSPVPSINNSDVNVYRWLDRQMESHVKWSSWHSKVKAYRASIGIGVGSEVGLHYDFLMESAAGIEAHNETP